MLVQSNNVRCCRSHVGSCTMTGYGHIVPVAARTWIPRRSEFLAQLGSTRTSASPFSQLHWTCTYSQHLQQTIARLPNLRRRKLTCSLPLALSRNTFASRKLSAIPSFTHSSYTNHQNERPLHVKLHQGASRPCRGILLLLQLSAPALSPRTTDPHWQALLR
jgi:hypothetical protein